MYFFSILSIRYMDVSLKIRLTYDYKQTDVMSLHMST